MAFGGQAVMEGVMIRSKDHLVVCVRQPNKEITTTTEKLYSVSEKYRFLKLPFLRGMLALIETLYSGVKGIYVSANAALDEEESFSGKELAVIVALSLCFSVLLFTVTPYVLTSQLNLSGVLFIVVESVIRLSILLGYLALISLVGDFKRIFQYHGAEHTAINAYEAGVELNVENARPFPRFHARCGTSFLLIVTLISIVFFSFITSTDYFVRLSYRILLIPIISAVSYELLKLSDKYRNSAVVKALVAPGVALQHLTTQPPDDEMLEVALTAVKTVERLQKGEE